MKAHDSALAHPRARLKNGAEVEVVIGRMEDDSHLPDHWRIAIYKAPSSAGKPLIESYPLPPETQDSELDSVVEELLAELNESGGNR